MSKLSFDRGRLVTLQTWDQLLIPYAQVLSQQGEMDDAVKRLQRAASINPEEKAIKQELARAVQKRDHMKEKEKAMYRRMVEGKPSTKSDKSKPKQGAPSWVS